MINNIIFLFFCVWLCGFVVFQIISYHSLFRKSLKNKVVLVTGCDAGGFGYSTVEALRKEGVVVIATCYTDDGVKKLNEEFKDTPNVVLKMDITKKEDVEAVIKETSKVLQQRKTNLYGLVNNAGVAEWGLFECIPLHRFNHVINVNLFGMTTLTRYCIPLMRRDTFETRQTPRQFLQLLLTICKQWVLHRGTRGRIVNICSVAGRLIGPSISCYSISKAGAIAFTDSIRIELQSLFGIWACTVEPQFTSSAMVTKSKETQLVKQIFEKELSPDLQSIYQLCFFSK
ncbi:hypothetical protein RFI_26085 [Reticulomyxa filosa]|uniref:Uncharacterized protein n=1 Tax=Reticulomyxa filosa TaxID=46433 RepID=X6MBA6_RETFI|nr:hypothetical protein RFI_26085 [Reticulomyxa filosa]|eukprot:ETO11293.1 hypothetical protein RFI_26085 [Reticulomyxa filosa]